MLLTDIDIQIHRPSTVILTECACQGLIIGAYVTRSAKTDHLVKYTLEIWV